MAETLKFKLNERSHYLIVIIKDILQWTAQRRRLLSNTYFWEERSGSLILSFSFSPDKRSRNRSLYHWTKPLKSCSRLSTRCLQLVSTMQRQSTWNNQALTLSKTSRLLLELSWPRFARLEKTLFSTSMKSGDKNTHRAWKHTKRTR